MVLDPKKTRKGDYDTSRHIFILISSIKGRLRTLTQLLTQTAPTQQHLNRHHLTIIENMIRHLYFHFNYHQDRLT